MIRDQRREFPFDCKSEQPTQYQGHPFPKWSRGHSYSSFAAFKILVEVSLISASDHAFGIVVCISLLLPTNCEFFVFFEHQFEGLADDVITGVIP
jgi:hypothetical protein